MEEETVDVESGNVPEVENDTETETDQIAITDSSEALEDSATNVVSKDASSKTVSKPVRHIRLPFSKIKQIMKMDPDVMLVQHDAVFLVAKATEMFIEFISKETNKQLAGSKRKTVAKRDVEATIENISQLCFLDGALE